MINFYVPAQNQVTFKSEFTKNNTPMQTTNQSLDVLRLLYRNAKRAARILPWTNNKNA